MRHAFELVQYENYLQTFSLKLIYHPLAPIYEWKQKIYFRQFSGSICRYLALLALNPMQTRMIRKNTVVKYNYQLAIFRK